MLNFTSLLNEAKLPLLDVRLLRHQAYTQFTGYSSPYILWRDNPALFDAYQETQAFGSESKLRAKYWASFVALPDVSTLFVGLYSVTGCRPLSQEEAYNQAGCKGEVACNLYTLEKSEFLNDLAGRLLIDWGAGYRSWIQRADRQPKPILELRKEFKEPEFLGFTRFISKLSDLDGLPNSWLTALSSTRGIYLLTCPKTKEQYVGSACGAAGFIGRWRDYAITGHGGNVGLKNRDASDYQISILETVGNSASENDILSLETLWKSKLQSREMGLNRN